ncbi:Crp/Fnr family transcriptional regulator [Mucilaginibacter sp. PAMB04168]|uniref:Crp/Fnr family transcriptional regulator n=1 Tax=Mucilaginibacter sp. PAMB04168 TaxID=3138567 RepID=UPI0031F62A00
MITTAINQQDIQRLHQVFNSIAVFDDEPFNAMLPHWGALTCKRKQILTQIGETEHYLYLITEGIQRGFCNYEDKDVTLVFFYPNSFAGIADSFLLQRPSALYFETLTASRMLRISYNNFMQIAHEFPQVEKWLRIMLSHTLAGLLERQKELSVYTAADKLAALFRRSAFIFNMVPHKYLASYIGVDPATFSKMYSRLEK